MHPDNEYIKLILADLQEVKKDVKEIRQSDLPELKTETTLLKDRVKSMRHDIEKKAQIWSGIGSALALTVSLLISRMSK